MSRKYNKHNAYSWVAYMVTHQPEEMARIRKYGTPSNQFLTLSDTPVAMTTADGEKKVITFPLSLHTNRGQKALYEILARFDAHLKSIPIKMYHLFQHVKTTVLHRRSDTQSNVHMVAEAILHRAACEFKLDVIFAFDSINSWITTVYKKTLGYNTLRKALELLQEAGVLKILEWGVKNNRHRATKIRVIPAMKKTVTTFTADVDDWLMFRDFGMTAVYARESVTRLNVLEKAIHHYADMLIKNEEDVKWADMIIGARGIEGAFDLPVEIIDAKETNDYFNRLLGELVPTMQEDHSVIGQAGSGISRPGSIDQSRSRSPAK